MSQVDMDSWMSNFPELGSDFQANQRPNGQDSLFHMDPVFITPQLQQMQHVPMHAPPAPAPQVIMPPQQTQHGYPSFTPMAQVPTPMTSQQQQLNQQLSFINNLDLDVEINGLGGQPMYYNNMTTSQSPLDAAAPFTFSHVGEALDTLHTKVEDDPFGSIESFTGAFDAPFDTDTISVDSFGSAGPITDSPIVTRPRSRSYHGFPTAPEPRRRSSSFSSNLKEAKPVTSTTGRRRGSGSRGSMKRSKSGSSITGEKKQCVCCMATSTPMWRDGRDGQRLCNACGIRWQKYGVSCHQCSYVPRKLENTSGQCKRCGADLPPPAPTRRRMASLDRPRKREPSVSSIGEGDA